MVFIVTLILCIMFLHIIPQPKIINCYSIQIIWNLNLIRDPMMTMSSLLMLEDSNTGCSSIRSVRSALEGSFAWLEWLGIGEKGGEAWYDSVEDLVRVEELLEVEKLILLCFDGEASGLDDWSLLGLNSLAWSTLKGFESSGDTERDRGLVTI